MVAVEAGALFDVRRVQLFQSIWDPHDDTEDDNGVVAGAWESGENVARVTRAVLEALLTPHFAERVLDELFTVFARLVARHLEKEKTKFIVLSSSSRSAQDRERGLGTCFSGCSCKHGSVCGLIWNRRKRFGISHGHLVQI